MSNDSVSLFISYSHRDEVWRERLAAHLAVMRRERLINEWHDRKIVPGAEWNEAIRSELNDADVILLLLSPDFLASDYCNDHEIPAAMALHEAGSAVVIPVYLRPCDWTSTPVAKLQGFPADARPVDSFASQDEALLSVAKGVRAVANRLLDERRARHKAVEDARARYRKKVEETLADGVISTGERDTLNELRVEEGLSLDDASGIEAEALAPLRRLNEAQEGYRRTLLKILEQGWPLSEADQKDLRLRKRDLGLKDGDVEHIETPLFAQAEAGLLPRRPQAATLGAAPVTPPVLQPGTTPSAMPGATPGPSAAPAAKPAGAAHLPSGATLPSPRAAAPPIGQAAVSVGGLPKWLWAAVAAGAVVVSYIAFNNEPQQPAAEETTTGAAVDDTSQATAADTAASEPESEASPSTDAGTATKE